MSSFEDLNINISIPPIYDNPVELRTIYQIGKFAPSGWMLNQSMVGTRWYNFYTGNIFLVVKVGDDIYKQLDMLDGSNNFMGLGIWRNNHYQVEHWARVDHLPPIVEYRWLLFRAAYRRKQYEKDMAEVKQMIETKNSSDWHANAEWKRKGADVELRYEHEALEIARNFALEHGLQVTLDDINKNRIGQLALF
jgi:hypothetical protein